MRLIILALLLGSAVPAKDKTDKPEAPVPSTELRLKLWRTTSEKHAADLNLERSQLAEAARVAEYRRVEAIAEWVKFCGPTFKPGNDPLSGEPSCVPKEPSPQPVP